MPIAENQMHQILAAVPGFAQQWQQFRDEWKTEELIPWYQGMSELAHYLVNRYEAGNTLEFSRLFEAVEVAFASGDKELDNLLSVGLLEDLQNVASHRSFGPKVFEAWLQPRTLTAWREVERGMSDVAKFAHGYYRRYWWQFWRPKRFNADEALAAVENAELRKIIESSYRKSS